MEPRASILIPVYNRQNLIGLCIESALAQTITDIEIVVCDNCSSDGTWGVLEDYAARDSRVRIFRNANNVGPVRNWARCVSEARAPYSKILFSDDLMAATFLEKTLPLIDSPEVGLVFSACEIGEQPGRGIVRYRFPRSGVWESGSFLAGHVFPYDVPFSPGAALFRTDDLKNLMYSGDRGALSEAFLETGAGPDVLLLLASEHLRGHVAHVPQPLMFFRSHPNSITIRQHDRVHSLYRRAIAAFIFQHRPGLLGAYLSRVQLSLGISRGKVEVEAILNDIGATFHVPTLTEFVPDAIRCVWVWCMRKIFQAGPGKPSRER